MATDITIRENILEEMSMVDAKDTYAISDKWNSPIYMKAKLVLTSIIGQDTKTQWVKCSSPSSDTIFLNEEEGIVLVAMSFSGYDKARDVQDYVTYYKDFQTVVKAHLGRIAEYRAAYPNKELVFLVDDETKGPYLSNISEWDENLKGMPYFPFIDTRIVSTFEHADIDYLILYVPYVDMLPLEDDVELPKATIFDVQHMSDGMLGLSNYSVGSVYSAYEIKMKRSRPYVIRS